MRSAQDDLEIWPDLADLLGNPNHRRQLRRRRRDPDGIISRAREIIGKRRQEILDSGEIEQVDPIVPRFKARCDFKDAETNENPLV